jgi:hypothetical protein
LITACWEAYCEDLASEALAHIVKFSESSDAVPDELKKQIAKEIKAAQHELEMWKIADDGWKQYLTARLGTLTEERNRRLNTPKTKDIDELFYRAIGLPSISNAWKWPTKMTAAKARNKLDKYVALRGSIAHRAQGATAIKKADVTDFLNLIKRLAEKTEEAVHSYVTGITRRWLGN